MKAAFERARAAIDFLWRHQLDPDPAFYALALLHVGDPGGRLAREVADLTDGGLRLSEEQASRLVELYIGSTAAVALREREVRAHADTLQTITDDAHGLATGMGRDLTAIGADDTARDTLVERMIERLAQAERQLGDMRNDIADLKGRLHDRDREQGNDSVDTLTEIPNRRGSAATMAGLSTHPLGYVVALCVCDELAAINERYGRAVGDNVLRAMASTLTRSCPGHGVVRWSGNEFVAVMKGASLAVARTMLEDARAAMASRTFRLRGTGALIGKITMSAGLAAGRAEPPQDVIARARQQTEAAVVDGGDTVRG